MRESGFAVPLRHPPERLHAGARGLGERWGGVSVSVSVLGRVGVTETPEETLLLLLLLQLLVGKLTCQLLGWKVLSAPAWTH